MQNLKNTKVFEIVRYTADCKNEWNHFMEESINGTFLFDRDYMDYHVDRFTDFSLLIYKKNKLFALLPANIQENVIYSHQGLTYGGFIINKNCKTSDFLAMWKLVMVLFKKNGFTKFLYKTVPHIYHLYPAETDLYALFLTNSKLVERHPSSAITLSKKITFSPNRKEGIRKAKKENIVIKESDSFKDFWKILNNNLTEKHNSKPVHNIEEIELLHNRFPDKIKLFLALKNNQTIGGTVIYETKNVIRTQYISADEEGKKVGVIDLLFDFIINSYYESSEKFFDFGQSSIEDGRILNESLIFQKEGFGARTFVYDIYEIDLR